MSDDVQQTRFDPQLRAVASELTAAIREFADSLVEQELTRGKRLRRRTDVARRNFNIAVEALVCNLFLLSLMPEDVALAVPRAHGTIWGSGRYSNPVYGQHFLHAIDIMSATGFIKELSRGFRYSNKNKASSLILSTAALRDHLPFASLDWRAIKRIEDPELIILKAAKDADGQSIALSYPETAVTKSLRREVSRINKHLQQANIELTGDHPAVYCQSALDWDPVSASNRDPFERRARVV